jgi:hypothetical protein
MNMMQWVPLALISDRAAPVAAARELETCSMITSEMRHKHSMPIAASATYAQSREQQRDYCIVNIIQHVGLKLVGLKLSWPVVSDAST